MSEVVLPSGPGQASAGADGRARSVGCVVVTEARFYRGPDGFPRCLNGTRAYPFWARYLDAFDSVRVVARVFDDEIEDGQRVEGPGVSVWPMPAYAGPRGFLRVARKLLPRLRDVANADAVHILRTPGILPVVVARNLRRRGRRYGLEVVGDPYDVFSAGGAGGRAGQLLRRFFTRELQQQCLSAAAVSYVTEKTLQGRYPAGSGAFTTNYSSVELPPEAFVRAPRVFENPPKPLRLVGIGRLGQLYKGPDLLIEAAQVALATGLELEVHWIGGGRHQDELTRRVDTAGLRDRFTFVGELESGSAIWSYLDAAHVFVMPSRTEGLPRAMIEAMARGLPCIGSDVGGIPELLGDENLFTAGDSTALYTKLRDLAGDVPRLNRMSRENLVLASSFSSQRLRARRQDFYRKLRTAVEAQRR